MNDNTKRNLNLPIYNIKAVSRLVGLLPVTLRAWERRYGLPQPGRGDQGYRLYSDYDVRILGWLKTQIGTGLSIGRAVEYLNELRTNGYDPAAEPVYQARPTLSHPVSPTLDSLAEQLLDALIHFDEPGGLEIMRRAFALHSVDQVLMRVVQPTLVALGEAWHRGEMPIAVEHYATQFCMQHLMSMLAAAAPPSRPGRIVAACAPGEQHQIGLLILVVMLRWRGWDIKYLGPDLPLDRLEEALRPIHPQILMFSANRVETAEKLSNLPKVLDDFPKPHPIIILGGQAFTNMHLPDNMPAIYLQMPPTEIVERIEDIMLRSMKAYISNSEAGKA
ncbi:MAG: MerR family transcriptional regulator [Anaerolineaceae bacterium]|nr:MerR family transcriptional regulator [Anaerolineaceae bacterium]